MKWRLWQRILLGAIATVIAIPVGLFLWWFFVPPYMYQAEHRKATEVMVGALEAHRKANGRYPATLRELPIARANPLPFDSRVELRYAVTPAGDRCWIGFDAFHTLMPAEDFHEYDCAAREWSTRPLGQAKIVPGVGVENFPQ